MPIEAVHTAYYLRMSALDKPGVLTAVGSIMSDRGISIEAIIQKRPRPGQDHVPLIMLTNKALESDLMAAVTAIEDLDAIAGKVVHIRVEALDK